MTKLAVAVILVLQLCLAFAQDDGSCSVTHTVATGDTVLGLAGTFGTTAEAIAAANPAVEDINTILIGQNLTIPTSCDTEGATPNSPASGGGGSCTVMHTVETGDTLFNIANEFGTTVDAILEANPDVGEAENIEVDQVLSIPATICDK